ncbi:MAG TPA: hypothetical protein VFG83_01840 [Kofleriaceae bacterium]|nr:hypothetical protein [Kofleriaceae bacterium]
MQHARSRSLVYVAALATLALAVSANRAHAQAWAGNQGEGEVELGTAFQYSNTIMWGEQYGRVTGLPAQEVRTHLTVEYTPIDRFTVGATLPFQLNRYSGRQTGPNPGVIFAHGTNDDGDWHSNFTDLHLDARYQVLQGDIALSPIIQVKIPVSDYENRGYAASGNGLFEVGAGAYIGKLGVFTDNLLVQAGYTFTWVQKEDGGGEATEAYSMHHSDASLVFGYIFTPSFWAAAGTSLLWTHGGFDLADYPDADPILKEWHDPIASRRAWSVNVSASYSLTDTLALTPYFGAVLLGKNVSNAMTGGVNLTWTYLPEP